MAAVIDENPDGRDVIVIRPSSWPGAEEGEAAAWLRYDRDAVTATWFGYDRTRDYAGAVEGYPYAVKAGLSDSEVLELEAALHRFAGRLEAEATTEEDRARAHALGELAQAVRPRPPSEPAPWS